jgi:DNA modification methylase
VRRASRAAVRNGAGNLKQKDLVGIPWMLAFALRADGWYLRSDIIWSKPNPMPESVTDRPTKAHEYLFLLSKSQRYYYDAEAIKEPMVCGFTKTGVGFGYGYDAAQKPRVKGHAKTFRGGGTYTQGRSFDNSAEVERESHGNVPNETGTRNKRTVWTIATQPYKGAHFATFPPKLIEPCIMAGSKLGDTIIDPFNGSGTTGVVSLKHRRKYIGIDLARDYIELTIPRLQEAQQQLKLAL